MIYVSKKRILVLIGLPLCLILTAMHGSGELITVLPVPKWEESQHPPADIPLFFSSGIPLEEGKVVSPDHLLLRDSGGHSVASQFTPLAYWPDGSLKWIGISPVLTAKTGLPVSLYKEEAKTDSSRDLVVSESRNGIVLENSRVRVHVGGQGGSFLLESKGNGESVQVDWMLDRVLRSPRKVRSGWLASRKEIGDSPVTSYTIGRDRSVVVELEEKGPVRAVVRVRGHFANSSGESFCRYDYRIYVYSGTGTVRWQPTWIFDGNPETDSIGRMEAVYQSNRTLPGSAVAGVLTEEGTEVTLPLKSGESVIQEEVDTLRLGAWEGKGRLAGWLSMQETSISQTRLNVAVKEFWQNYPSGFAVDGNTLVVGLWPGFSRSFLDLARTSDGKGVGELSVDAKADATGVGKTFDMLVSLEADPGSFATVAAVFDQEPLFYPGSHYMVKTGVLGPLAVEDPEGFPRLEGMMRTIMFWLLENRNRFGWYGFIDYGDVRTNTVRDHWRMEGRYGWRQGSGDVPQAIMTQYFRTGDPVAWELGAPYARHVLDIDTVHHARLSGDQPVGAMHRRGQDHWSGMVQSPYTYTQGAFLYHYLSGDLRARSVLLEEVAPWQSDPIQAYSSNAMNTVVRAWEATGDPKWRELARQQFLPHRNGHTYHHFRFAADFVPALAQYTWLTGEEEAIEEVRLRGNWLLDAERWAYFNPGIHSRGGRFLLPALMYLLDGDPEKYVKYPVRRYATLLPPLPPARLDWESLDDYRRQIPPTGITETTQVGDFGYIPYFMAVLQDIGWGEKEIQQQPDLYGVGDQVSLVGTYSDVGQQTVKHENAWQMLALPETSPDWTEVADTAAILKSMKGLPFGGILYVNHIPFHLRTARGTGQPVLLHLSQGETTSISVPKGAAGLYLLGPMIEKGDLREGAEVVKYVLHLRGGGVREGVWRNLLDLNDYRGFHYATGSTPGRFWQTGNESRVHASVLYLDFEGDDIEKVELQDCDQGYTSFVIAATAEMPGEENAPVLAEITFSGEPLLSGENASRFVLSKGTLADTASKGAGWIMSAKEVNRMKFVEDKVVSDGLAGLQIPLENGGYLVEMNIRNTHGWGGAVEISVSGNTLSGFGLSGGAGDRLRIPARVTDGVLQVMVHALPGLLSNPNQKAEWELSSVRVYPLPKGDWLFQEEQPLVMLEGEPLGSYAALKKSVGNRGTDPSRGMDKLLLSSGEYRVLNAEFPQDIIFVFKEPVNMTGFVFSALAGQGPSSLSLQVKRRGDKIWREMGQWSLSEDHSGLREVVKESSVSEVRVLMHEGHAKHLRLLEVNIYGTR